MARQSRPLLQWQRPAPVPRGLGRRQCDDQSKVATRSSPHRPLPCQYRWQHPARPHLHGADDGMAARFLYAWPAPPKYRSILTCPTVDSGSAQVRLKRIAGISGTADHPRILHISGEAQALLDAFLSELHAEALHNDGLEAG